MSQHTKGPLLIIRCGSCLQIESDKYAVAHTIGNGEHDMANAARLVACWNACEGINPEAVLDILAALQGLSDAVYRWREKGKPYLSDLTTASDAARAAIERATGGR